MAYVKRNNAIVDKSFYFGCDIVNFSRELKKIHEFEIASQLIRCGTSIGANIRESQRAVSTKDFKNKLGIVHKEAEETDFWIDILEETTMQVPNELKTKCQVLIKLLVTIIKNS
jgi:four helix bundle protein